MGTSKIKIDSRTIIVAMVGIAFCYWAWPVTIPFLNMMRDYSLPHVLKTMDGVGIRMPIPAIIDGHAGKMSGSTIAVLDALHNPEMFNVLRHCSGFHASPQTADYDFTLSIRGFEGKQWTDYPGPYYYYCSKTGELGRDHEWCYVPPIFKIWMEKIKPTSLSGMPIHIDHQPRVTIVNPKSH